MHIEGYCWDKQECKQKLKLKPSAATNLTCLHADYQNKIPDTAEFPRVTKVANIDKAPPAPDKMRSFCADSIVHSAMYHQLSGQGGHCSPFEAIKENLALFGQELARQMGLLHTWNGASDGPLTKAKVMRQSWFGVWRIGGCWLSNCCFLRDCVALRAGT